MFWVGLMDGNGNIQVNNLRKKSLQYRLIIKLNSDKFNNNMLAKITKVIGGYIINLKKKNKEVIWVVDNIDTIYNCIKIFEKYPPLTSRLICQLNFLKVCLADISVEKYLIERNLKYNNQSNIINNFNNNFIIPSYFSSWLSGFIEAKGCFNLKEKGNHSFLIIHSDDYYLLNSIKNFFLLSVSVKNPSKAFYSLEIFKKESLNNIISHCKSYPLLGNKSKSLSLFIKYIS